MKKIRVFFTSLFFLLVISIAQPLHAIDGEITYTGSNTGLAGDDVSAGPFNIGFPFTFYGTEYTQAHTNINGTITFGAGFAAYSNCALNSCGADNTIYAFWDDLNTLGAQNIYYATIGSAPNRMYVTQWTNIYFHGTTIQMGTFQIILYEGSNKIKLQYRDLLGGNRALGNDATIGLKKNNATTKQYSNATASLTQGQAIEYTPNGANDYTVNASSSYELVYLAPAGAPTSPVLVNPTDGTTGVTLSPTFEWLPVASTTSYTLLVSTVSNFSSTVVNQAGITGTSYTLGSNLSPSTQYYWRVQSVNSFGSSLSSSRTFTTGSTNEAPSSPSAVLSDTLLGGATSTSFIGGTLTATLADPDVDEQVRYRIQIASDSGFSSLLLDYRSPFGAEGPITYTVGENTGTYLVGSATTTLNPGSYYVRIRTEDDAAASSVWVFAGSVSFILAADTVAPAISSLSITDLGTTTAVVSWTTDELASSRVEYGPGAGYGTTTAETNMSLGVTSHEVQLTGLASCVTYSYRVWSGDAAVNYATSSLATFTTKGCTGSSLVVTQATSTQVATSTGASLDLLDGAKGIELVIPPGFSSSTQGSVYFQLKKLEEDVVVAVTGLPTNLTPVADHTYALHAITDGLVSIVEFDEDIMLTIRYSDADVSGINPATLKIYRWNDNVWSELGGCVVDTGVKTVTCTTDHFSTFTLFGQALSGQSASVSSVPPVIYGNTIQAQIIELTNMGKMEEAAKLSKEWNVGTSTQIKTDSTVLFSRDLKKMSKGPDVKKLQEFLNAAGFAVASAGESGSAGFETDMFGTLTQKALIRFQKAKGISPAVGYFGKVTRGVVESIK